MSVRLFVSILLILRFSSPSDSIAQGVKFVRNQHAFQIPNPHLIFHPIGVIAGRDTLVYTDDPSKAWTITQAHADSLRISRPIRWRDTLVERHTFRYPDGYSYWEDLRIDGKKMTQLIVLDSTETKAFPWSVITALHYPTYSGKGNGCMGWLLIPGFNIGFII